VKVLLVHNEYGKPSGEEMVVNGTRRLLEEHGHEVVCFTRSSAEIETMRWGRTRSFFSEIYSQPSRLTMRRLLAERRPDVVHIHNLFPLISPSILPECRNAGVPVVMTLHNYRLVCPNGLEMVRGRICDKCSGGREYWCIIRNCEGSYPKSIGYAIRNYVARKRRYYLDNVTVFVALTKFQRERLLAVRFPAERTVVIPNTIRAEDSVGMSSLGDYVGYIGRISPEKDIPTLLDAARRCSEIPFMVAGVYDRMPQLLREAPANLRFLGHLDRRESSRFVHGARLIVLCSICFENFPMAVVEAMIHAKPVICSRIGGLPEIVEDGRTGLLFQPGDPVELAEKIRYLWSRPELCWKLGQAGRAKALREYSSETYYDRLMGVYRKAIELVAGERSMSTAVASEMDN